MDRTFHACKAVSIAAFLFYGIFCLRSDSMVAEFERFGLPRLRTLTGVLEVLGALGLLVGYRYAPLTVFSAGGLALLMLMGVIVRMRIGDSLVATLPALGFLVVNAFICAHAITSLAADRTSP